MLSAFHFQQPLWLLLFPLLLAVGYFWKRTSQSREHWSRVCDPALLPFLLKDEEVNPTKKTALVGAIIVVSALLAAAAAQPVWQKQPVPAFKQGGAVVIALDLSASMNATDLKPSRLQRAHFKIQDLVDRLPDSQIALVVYAGEAFVVTPLTEDSETVIAQLPILTPEIMPVLGSRADKAIAKADELFAQAGIVQGQIVLVSDEISPSQIAAQATASAKMGHILSVLAVGTEQGAPVPTKAGPLKMANGQVVVARTVMSEMSEAASLGGGQAYALVSDDSDISRLVTALNTTKRDKPTAGSEVDSWIAEGPWFVLFALPFLLPLFKRGVLNVMLPVLVGTSVTVGMTVSPNVQAGVWQDLWKTQDQQAYDAYQKGDKQGAAEQFTDPRWKQIAEYETQQYEKSLERVSDPKTTEDWYNRGTILARKGELDPAIEAFDKALVADPDFEDAAYNKRLLEKLKADQEKQKQQSSDQSNQGQEKKDQESEDQQSSDQNQSTQDQANQNQGSQDQSQQNKSDQSQANQQKSDQKGDQPQDQNQAPQPSDTDEERAPSSESKSASQSGDEPPEPMDTKQSKSQADTADSKQAAADYLKQQLDDAPKDDNPTSDKASIGSDTTEPLDETEQARQQLLNRIVDDPAGLWRRKFLYQYRQNAEPNAAEEKTW